MAKPINLVLTLRDGKNRYAQMIVNVVNQDEDSNILHQIEMAKNLQVDIDAMVKGQIVQCGVVIDVPIEGGLKTTPDADSDVEEGALFIFQSVNGYLTKIRVPTVGDDLFITGSPLIDFANADVSQFVDNILDGYLYDISNRHDVTDSRGDDVIDIKSGAKDFENPRV